MAKKLHKEFKNSYLLCFPSLDKDDFQSHFWTSSYLVFSFFPAFIVLLDCNDSDK